MPRTVIEEATPKRCWYCGNRAVYQVTPSRIGERFGASGPQSKGKPSCKRDLPFTLTQDVAATFVVRKL